MSLVRFRKPSAAAEAFEPAVDRLCWAVAGAGSVEAGEHVGGALLQRPAELGDLDQGPPARDRRFQTAATPWIRMSPFCPLRPATGTLHDDLFVP